MPIKVISSTLKEAASKTYRATTLAHIDSTSKLEQLHTLMREKKLYQESNLDLQTVASQLDISTHQLSELINTRLDKNFSHYIRKLRVEAAKKALLLQPSLSVISVGLDVGFSSQTSLYDAFREFTNTTPAKYRKQYKNK